MPRDTTLKCTHRFAAETWIRPTTRLRHFSPLQRVFACCVCRYAAEAWLYHTTRFSRVHVAYSGGGVAPPHDTASPCARHCAVEAQLMLRDTALQCNHRYAPGAWICHTTRLHCFFAAAACVRGLCLPPLDTASPCTRRYGAESWPAAVLPWLGHDLADTHHLSNQSTMKDLLPAFTHFVSCV